MPQSTLLPLIKTAIQNNFNFEASDSQLQFQETRKEFTGDITLVVFPLTKPAGKSPEQIGEAIGAYLLEHSPLVKSYNQVKGFLNIELHEGFYLNQFNTQLADKNFGKASTPTGRTVMVEYSSPNTNKPLHLGHLRNIFLGYSVAEILKAAGNNVKKVQIINDRGIHICKSMLAWKLFGNGETPASSGMKGDKLVGKYYVEFDKELKKQYKPIEEAIKAGDHSLLTEKQSTDVKNHLAKISELTAILEKEDSSLKSTNSDLYQQLLVEDDKGTWKSKIKFVNSKYESEDKKLKEFQKLLRPLVTLEEKIDEQKELIKDIAQSKTEIMQGAKAMLQAWETEHLLGNGETLDLWNTMNGWVYEGFNKTYTTMKVDFDKLYYESNTYLLGKEEVMKGLEKGIFFQKPDGSVWVDLTADGLDEKLLLRGDGTAVYMTQDIGTAILRYKDQPDLSQLIYTVGNEQDYHFKVLFLILQKLGFSWAKECYHLSYGMVDLPTGKMKSREGTVVDADDLMQEMVDSAREISEELGKLDDATEAEKNKLYSELGLGALKYFLLKVEPKKRMLFNPAESIDFAGHTGPFIQYTHARICSVLRKAGSVPAGIASGLSVNPSEKELMKRLAQYPAVIQDAAHSYSPALIANYVYELTKEFNHFYQTVPILKEENKDLMDFRVALSALTARVIASGMQLLGIEVPERM